MIAAYGVGDVVEYARHRETIQLYHGVWGTVESIEPVDDDEGTFPVTIRLHKSNQLMPDYDYSTDSGREPRLLLVRKENYTIVEAI